MGATKKKGLCGGTSESRTRDELDLLPATLRLLRWIIADRLNQAFGNWVGYEE